MGRSRCVRARQFATRLRRVCQWAGTAPFTLTCFARGLTVELQYRPWKGYTLTRWKVGNVLYDNNPWIEAGVENVKRRTCGIDPASPGASSPYASILTKLLVKFPAIIAHLSVSVYDDGSPRQAGWITIKAQGGMWVIQVKDPDAGASLTISHQSLDDAFAAAEVALSSDTTPWQPDRFLQDKKPKRGKS